jgi:hypothetical protein
MKKFIFMYLAMLIVAGCQSANRMQSTSLFNGSDLSGWHVDIPKMDNDPSVKSAFVVRDGLLVSLGEPQGHLITDKVYQDYRLEVEYRFSAKPGNCGGACSCFYAAGSLQDVSQVS